MQLVVLALLRKVAPYLVLVMAGLSLGFYAGYQLGSAGLARARLALSVQQADDAKAIAAANADAAAELEKANGAANAAEKALVAANAQAGSTERKLTSQIANQAAQPGQDAPDAPVLAHTLDALRDER